MKRSGHTTTAEALPYGYLPTPPAIERRKSKIHGWGVFALQTIRKNTRIIHYAGEKIPNQQSLKREARYLKRGHIWCFKLTNRSVIDAGVGGNVARFINHACKPNCYIHIKDGMIWIRAARTIRKGEELTYNYNTDGDAGIKCRASRVARACSEVRAPMQLFYLHGFASARVRRRRRSSANDWRRAG